MKQVPKLLFLLFLYGCNDKKQEKLESIIELESEPTIVGIEKEQDTIRNYWQLNRDTIFDKVEFKGFDLKYMLEIRTFSLNDSSIVRSLGQSGSKVYLDYSHKTISELGLLTGSFTDTKRIDRTDFKNLLNPDFYVECNLQITEIDTIQENKIYLTSDLSVPDTDNQWRIWYSIEIINNRFGDVEFIESEYVGL